MKTIKYYSQLTALIISLLISSCTNQNVHHIEKKYSNGQVCVSYNVVEDSNGKYKLTGKYFEYYENGNQQITGQYNPDFSDEYDSKDTNIVHIYDNLIITPTKGNDGKWTEFYKNGNKHIEYNFKNGLQDGEYTIWYENGELKTKGIKYKDEREGVWISWYENGNKKSEEIYKNGVREGKWILWHENSVKAIESTMTEDSLFHGNFTAWYENGEKKLQTNYISGVPDGKYIEWFENGKKKLESNYKNGLLDGKYTVWYENGNIKYTGFSIKDKEDGEWTWWYENGHKQCTGFYKNGEKDGDFIYYDQNGQISEKLSYKNGKEIQKPKCQEMVFIKGGDFMMGSNDGERDEKPVHKVSLSDFYIGKYEITELGWYDVLIDHNQRLYEDLKKLEKTDFEKAKSMTNSWVKYNNDGDLILLKVEKPKSTKINLPKGSTWNEAVEFCNWRSEKEGLVKVYTINGEKISCNFHANGYRLPTEAEWEYAAKGGKNSKDLKYSGSSNYLKVAWMRENSGYDYFTRPVGTKQPNELGLFDMSGNVFEWCWDWYDSDYYKNTSDNNPTGPSSGSVHVLRGGGWSSKADDCRIANRDGIGSPGYRDYDYGFRLVRKP